MNVFIWGNGAIAYIGNDLAEVEGATKLIIDSVPDVVIADYGNYLYINNEFITYAEMQAATV